MLRLQPGEAPDTTEIVNTVRRSGRLVETVLAWILDVALEALSLLTVPRSFWIGLWMLLALKTATGVLYRPDHVTAWARFRKIVGETVRILFVLLGVTILANLAPVLGWAIPFTFTSAGIYTFGELVAIVTEADSPLRRWATGIYEMIRDRNRQAYQSAYTPAPAPVSGSPGSTLAPSPDVPYREPPSIEPGSVAEWEPSDPRSDDP